MLYYVIEERNSKIETLWDQSARFRPFKVEDGRRAADKFNAAVPPQETLDHRFRRIEQDDFIDRGGL